MLRRLEIKTLRDEAEGELNYRHWLKTVLGRPLNPHAGMSLDEMRRLLPLLDKIDPLKGDKPDSVVLEEAEHELLVARIKAYPFPGLARLFVAFADDVENAPSIEL